MDNSWLRWPIYFDDELRFSAVDDDPTPLDAVARICYVHDTIEDQMCEGRLLDRATFDQVDSLSDHLKTQTPPDPAEIASIADQLAERYGFRDDSRDTSRWVRRDADGSYAIWISDDTTVPAAPSAAAIVAMDEALQANPIPPPKPWWKLW